MFANKRIKLNETNERTNERLFGRHKKEVRNKSEQNNGANIKCVKSDKNELPIKMFVLVDLVLACGIALSVDGLKQAKQTRSKRDTCLT